MAALRMLVAAVMAAALAACTSIDQPLKSDLERSDVHNVPTGSSASTTRSSELASVTPRPTGSGLPVPAGQPLPRVVSRPGREGSAAFQSWNTSAGARRARQTYELSNLPLGTIDRCITDRRPPLPD